MSEMQWQKSTFSGDEGACIELAAHEGAIKMRESEDGHVIVTTDKRKLRAFILGVKAGEFDHLIAD